MFALSTFPLCGLDIVATGFLTVYASQRMATPRRRRSLLARKSRTVVDVAFSGSVRTRLNQGLYSPDVCFSPSVMLGTVEMNG